MAETHKPILVIVGATGFQGKSVLAEAHKTRKFHIRALTRNPKSEAAQKLVADYPGIETVAANNNDVKSLVAAFKGAEYAFLLTNFWDPEEKMDPDTDYRQGKNLADAAKEAGVKFVLWSSVHDVEKISKGTIDVPHMTNKNKVEEYLRSIGLEYAAIYAGYFANNWERFGMAPTREKDGSLTLPLSLRADVGLPIIDTEADFGKFAVRVLHDPKAYSGKHILAASEYQTVPQIVADYTRVTGDHVRIVPIPLETVQLKEFREMFRFWNDYGYYNGEMIDHDAFFGKDKPKLHNFGGWVERTGFRVPK
jgi:uncharacterized protein YbjT (DUF2867 family)